MISAAGSYTALRDGFASVGGSNLQSSFYWSSTEDDSYNSWRYYFGNGSWFRGNKDDGRRVRSCLAF